MAQFFVSCAMGFEQELISVEQTFWFEMIDLDGQPTRSLLPECNPKDGGIEIDVAEHLGFQINLFSKIANRVLLRIYKFEARYFDQLEKELRKLDLEKWLEPQRLQIKIETHKSRINNQKSIEEVVDKILSEKKFQAKSVPQAGDEAEIQKLYLRAEKDRFTISLDTSGAHLHRRGYAMHRGEAPLREVFAAYMFKQLKKEAKSFSDLVVVDPFVGSGTILFEALSEGSPNFKRDFAWSHFKIRPKLFKSNTWMMNYKWIRPMMNLRGIGIDQDAKSIENLNKNLLKFQEIFPQINSKIQAWTGDSLSVSLETLKGEKNLWLMTNPPYGHRLQEGSAIQILERFERELNLNGLVVLHPEAWNFRFQKLKFVSKLDFRNQGLRLKLSVYSL